MREEDRAALLKLMSPSLGLLEVKTQERFLKLAATHGLPDYVGNKTHTLGWFDDEGTLIGWYWEDQEFVQEKDPRVVAVRADPLVGNSTCSVITEAFSDDELLEHLNRVEAETAEEAVEEARDYHELWLERGLNQRWGDDDDPQLLAYNAWKTERAKAEVVYASGE